MCSLGIGDRLLGQILEVIRLVGSDILDEEDLLVFLGGSTLFLGLLLLSLWWLS